MASFESDTRPDSLKFDFTVVAVGYERRCRWVTKEFAVEGKSNWGLEFGFLADGSYRDNRAYFESLDFKIIAGLRDDVVEILTKAFLSCDSATPSIFIDISSMSREMIANVTLAVQRVRSEKTVFVTVAYAPSKFTGPYAPAPIRSASPIKPSLAGWSSQPEMPLGAIFGLGCEPDLALGALQLLEPNKAWIFRPKGIDPKFDAAMKAANLHIGDIFDVSNFSYEISKPASARGRLEALLNAIDKSFRLIVVPFGPKIFAWVAIATVVFSYRSNIGVWAFSSKDHATIVDRDAEGQVIWHSLRLEQTSPSRPQSE